MLAFVAVVVLLHPPSIGTSQEIPRPPEARFRADVELVGVSVTVTDAAGRFVDGLEASDFELREDGRSRPIDYFARERVPVSLVLVVDTSGSMEGDRLVAAHTALDRFLAELLGPDDEVALYRIADRPDRITGWTRERSRAARALRRLPAGGGTALFDTVIEAVALARTGSHPRRAVVLLTDGNDTSSTQDLSAARQAILASGVVVYAMAIDAPADQRREPANWPRWPPGGPPWPGLPRPPWWPPDRRPPPPPRVPPAAANPLDVATLRALTDESGGRTEVARDREAIVRITAGLATELNEQYFLGYVSAAPSDGRWHAIDVRVPGCPGCRVRHRRGFVGSP